MTANTGDNQMVSKTGRNEPCPCGSGKKYKKCHGKSGPTDKGSPRILNPEGILIRDFTHPQAPPFSIGSPGLPLYDSFVTRGNLKELERHPEKYIQIINIDIPAVLPLEEMEPIPLLFEGHRFLLIHKVKRRGEEFYSTIDSNTLPYFSTLQFQGEIYPGYLQLTLTSDRHHKSYYLIVDTLHKINSLLDAADRLRLGDDLRFSYHILYTPKDNFPNCTPIAKATFPYVGLCDIKSPKTVKTVDTSTVKGVLSQKLIITEFSKSTVAPKTLGKEFGEKVFILTHDFSFYCSQHPEAIQKLKEEHVRDLFLVLAKAVFGNAEGEPFHFDGKLDYKIANVDNKYEFVTGEFKWWTGGVSFKKAFHQAVRKHASGQESCIYILMLSRNQNAQAVYEEILTLVKSEPEYAEANPESIVPHKSEQLFSEVQVSHRGRAKRLIVGLIDCYHIKH